MKKWEMLPYKYDSLLNDHYHITTKENLIDVLPIHVEKTLMENGWEVKNNFYHKKNLPFCVRIGDVVTVSKDGKKCSDEAWIKLSIVGKKIKDYYKCLNNLILELYSYHYGIYKWQGDKYFLHENTQDVNIHICLINIPKVQAL